MIRQHVVFQETPSLGGCDIRSRVRAVMDVAPVLDMHTHLFAPRFGSLNLWGIDELLTYHYLVAEFLRSTEMPIEDFWRLPKDTQADRIWDALFVQNTPLSEAASGVVAVLTALGADPSAPDLRDIRAYFRAQDAEAHLDRVMGIAGVTEIVMTNDPFDPVEVSVWKAGMDEDSRFRAALRLDVLLNDWPRASEFLKEQGYAVYEELGGNTMSEVRRFLDDCTVRMEPVYAAVSLPDTFHYPEVSWRGRLIAEAILPACRDNGMPLAMMIGVRRQVNPALRQAGDGVGRADVRVLERLCADFPDNRFLVTMLSRENQHELCVAARKFRNLLPFGCWWFLNNSSIISEITRERFEMLGTSFIPQHSDARVLEHLIYKWQHSRRVVADALADSYFQLEENGRLVSDADIRRDVGRLFIGNFRQWVSRSAAVERVA